MVKIMRAFVLLPLIFPGCSANYIQSTNNIAKFNVEVTPYNDSFLLCKITGNSLDSALYIKSYDIDYYEDRVHI
ncbi:MAG: hypothetical protein JXR90_08950, partial [Spirochaetes bacterium]|nr:hypothetical protein [Spirochaetota bacterium]